VSEQNPSEAQQPQQYFGAAQPPPQQSFGQAPPPPGQGAYPPPPQQAYGAPPPVPAEQPKKKRGGLVRLGITLVVLAALGVGGWWFTRKDAVNANVGDCLAGTTPEELNADNLKIVPCTQSDAHFKVVQKGDNKTEANAESACTTDDYKWVFWSGEPGKSGTVLCLAENSTS
jgi:hypothetical protein